MRPVRDILTEHAEAVVDLHLPEVGEHRRYAVALEIAKRAGAEIERDYVSRDPIREGSLS